MLYDGLGWVKCVVNVKDDSMCVRDDMDGSRIGGHTVVYMHSLYIQAYIPTEPSMSTLEQDRQYGKERDT